MIIVYTGAGKGKTSACIGQAIRALGQGFDVAFAQFIKRPDIAGEQKILRQLLGDNFRAGGVGFYRGEDKKIHQQAARALLRWARERSVRLLVLDEVIYALGYGLLEQDEILPLLQNCENGTRHAVLSGRNAPDWLKNMARIVTEMRCEKHALDQGVKAEPGIEY